MATPLDVLLSRSDQERHLGPYILEIPLGRGGFAPVWKAREMYGATELRTVAIKIFHLPSSDSPSSCQHASIAQEAQALCRVEHPNIVRFHTIHIDENEGILGLVMEYLAGCSLEQRLRESGILTVADTIDLALQLTSALQTVHEAGLVHRDLKPANVIEVRKTYKLIDFGISTQEITPQDSSPKRVMLDDLPFEVIGTKMSMLTGAQTIEATARTQGNLLISGTVGYMDPFSVATGAPATPSSDLYGLGVLLFEALTGHLPASGDRGLRGDILDGRTPPPPLTTRIPSAPEPLAKLIDLLLCPEREGRPSSAKVVHDLLLQIQKDQSPRPSTKEAPVLVEQSSEPPKAITHPPNSKIQIRILQGIFFTVVLVGATLGISYFLRPPPCVLGATDACTQRCNKGESESCLTLGLMYERATGVSKDEVRAASLFQQACDQGNGAACNALGAMYEQGRGGKIDAEKARTRYERACSLSNMQGCNALAIQLSTGSGGPPDKARAFQLYQRACEGGYPNGCANLGALYERGDGVEKDEKRARTLYEQACNQGTSSSCGLLALALLAGRGGEPDPARAATLFERACNSGHAFACVGFGVLLEKGTHDHPPDRERAARIYHQACDDGERQGCVYLGQLYQRGEGVPIDEAQAVVLFQRACERGYPLGCRLAGEAISTGRGVQREDARAVPFFRQACFPKDGSARDAEGCAWLALHLRNGRGVPVSLQEAEDLQKKACEQGAILGCSRTPPSTSTTPVLLGEERPPQQVRPPH